MSGGDVTAEGERLIKQWLYATKLLRAAEEEMRRREKALNYSRDALAKWMSPGDASVGEKIAVWFGDSLVQVEVTEDAPIVTIRTRGRSMNYI